MNTLELLKTKTLALRKDRNPLGSTLQFHLSELYNVGKKENREVTDDDAIQYLKKAASKLKENPHSNPEELAIIESILPQMVSEDDVKIFIEMKHAEGVDTTNKGIMMKAIKNEFGSLVDMKMASKLI